MSVGPPLHDKEGVMGTKTRQILSTNVQHSLCTKVPDLVPAFNEGLEV